MISVGLELTGSSIKVAVVEGSRQKAQLKSFITRKIDAKQGETEDDIISVLNEVLKESKAPRASVTTAIRAQDCMIREIVVPFAEDDKIRKTVKYQAENYFTSMSIDDLIIEYSKFAESENRSKLLVAGIKKSHVARRLEMLEEVQVDPLAIDLDIAALYNTYAHLGVFADTQAALIVEVKADTLKLGVVDGGKLRLARAIRMRLGSMKLESLRPKRGGGGGGALADSGVYDTAADESARLPVVILDEGDDEAFSLEDSGITETEREGILHRVFMEIDRTVAAVQLAHDVDLICLTGSSCVLDGIEEVFSEHFEIDTKRIDIGDALGGKSGLGKGSVSIEGATAVGLALKGLGIDHGGMDFRQEEFAYQGTFQQLKKGMACLLTLLFAFTFLYAYGLKQELGEKRRRLDAVVGMQRNLYTVLFPNTSTDPNAPPHDPLPISGEPNYPYALKVKQDQLAKKYGGAGSGDSGPVLSSLEILRQFSLAKQKADTPRWGILVQRVYIDPSPNGRSTLTCTCKEEFGAIELEKQFTGHPTLEGHTKKTNPLKDGSGYTFEFEIKVKEQKDKRR
ncbi:MAG: pilus assembly protein PilM [Planctomycetota bacterium]